MDDDLLASILRAVNILVTPLILSIGVLGCERSLNTSTQTNAPSVVEVDVDSSLDADIDAEVNAYIQQLGDPNIQVRFDAAETLGRFGPEASAAIPALIETLQDSNHYVRTRAAYTLGEIGPEASAAIPTLLQMLQDPDPRHGGNILGTAAWALIQIGPEASIAIPAFTEALADPDAGVRVRAAQALAAIGPEAIAAAPALEVLLQDSYPRVRIYSADALWRAGADTEALLPVLLAVLQDPDDIVFEEVLFTIAVLAEDPIYEFQNRIAKLEDAELETAILALNQRLSAFEATPNTWNEDLIPVIEFLLNILQSEVAIRA